MTRPVPPGLPSPPRADGLLTRLLSGLRLLHACLRHLADEDAWERELQRRTPPGSSDPTRCGDAVAPTGCTHRPLDRGAFWQREMERRWSGIRRCC